MYIRVCVRERNKGEIYGAALVLYINIDGAIYTTLSSLFCRPIGGRTLGHPSPSFTQIPSRPRIFRIYDLCVRIRGRRGLVAVKKT